MEPYRGRGMPDLPWKGGCGFQAPPGPPLSSCSPSSSWTSWARTAVLLIWSLLVGNKNWGDRQRAHGNLGREAHNKTLPWVRASVEEFYGIHSFITPDPHGQTGSRKPVSEAVAKRSDMGGGASVRDARPLLAISLAHIRGSLSHK